MERNDSTYALLTSINTKNQLYKERIKTDVNNLDIYSRRSYYFVLNSILSHALLSSDSIY